VEHKITTPAFADWKLEENKIYLTGAGTEIKVSALDFEQENGRTLYQIKAPLVIYSATISVSSTMTAPDGTRRMRILTTEKATPVASVDIDCIRENEGDDCSAAVAKKDQPDGAAFMSTFVAIILMILVI
jgi:hypothetical protein